MRRGVIRVPLPALLGQEQGAAVEMVEGGKAKKVPVRVGARDGQWAEIAQGLEQGAQVIVQGNYALPDGTPVKPVEKPADASAGETSIPAADGGSGSSSGASDGK